MSQPMASSLVARQSIPGVTLRQATPWLVTAFIVIVAFGILPRVGDDYWFSAILTPFLASALAALGLNILTGYTGLLSLGSAAFMAVGAFATYNFAIRVPGLPVLVAFGLGGLMAALVGVLLGLPSLRIKGFYIIVSTLAAQFFVEWAFTKIGWFSNYSASGVISAPRLSVAGFEFNTPVGHYLFTAGVVFAMTVLAINLVRSPTGRNWMAVRDMDIAAAVIGIPILRTKLSAFAVSSFCCGIAGALWAFTYLGTVEPAGFDLQRSFTILFMVIIGGVGSIFGSFLGAAFIVLFPILLSRLSDTLLGGAVDPGIQENVEKIIFGGLMIIVLILEPRGLARMIEIGTQRCLALVSGSRR